MRKLNDNHQRDWHGSSSTAPAPLEIGTAAGGTSNGVSVGINTSLVDQLNSGSYWYTSSGVVAQTITYGFTTSNTFATGFGEASGWSTFTEAQKTAVRQMMTLWGDLITPSFVESTGSPDTADIKFSNTTTGPSYAWAYYPGQVNKEVSSYDKIAGSVWLNPAYNSGVNNLVTPTSGVYGYMAILHEIGHAIGLDHGGNYNGGSPAYGDTSTGWLYTEDSRQFTIMSYFNASATGANWGGKYAQTPMVYDVLAIQQIYGADYTTRAGDTTYGFNSNAGNALYDFSQNTTPILTIWDGAGIDTIDLSGWSSNSVLNLTAGSYSNVAGMTKNLAIAFGVDIETATGGTGNDTITGNDLANILLGGGGNDTLNGAGGNDTINGGIGVDILNGGAGDDTIYFDVLDNLTLLDGGAGFDTLIQLGVLITFDYAGHSFERLLDIITDAASAAWSQQTDYYDFSGLYYEMDITYDNGTRSVTEYDVYNAETWSEWTVTYDANGNVISSEYVPDDGEPPVNSAPSITSNGGGATAGVSISENTTAVTTVAATDANAGAVLTYLIVGGADASKFAINAATGILSFISGPDFEAPNDFSTNNVYDVQVRVSDGELTDTQTIAVTVTNQNEAPTITSVDGGASALGTQGAVAAAAVNVAEGTTAVTTVIASDPDADAVLTYSITGGADASKFTINASTGVLSFISAQDFEAPGDVGANNVYDVQVQVSDGALTDTQAIEATVTDVDDALIVTTINGTSSNNVLTGTAGINIMDGLAGSDTLAGLGGADTLVGGAGTDTATYAASTAGVNVSLMTGLGSGGDAEGDTLSTIENLTGSNFDDILEGNAASNVLNGGLGIDTVSYEHAAAGVTISLVAPTVSKKSRATVPAGTDTLSGFENLTGSAFNDSLTGNTGNNVLKGLAGNDTMNGGAGAATMFGGLGNDTYVVDNIGDIVDETDGDGTDTIQTALAFSLAALGSIENLRLTGSAAIAGTGNDLANFLTGNSSANLLTGLGGNDTLNGGTGADTMIGGTGNDTYVIDNTGDIADETGGDGTDTIQSAITFSLSDAVHAKGIIENLTLTGTSALNGTGNTLANVITGNNGSNTLAGLGGADTLIGGLGTDTATYVASLEGVNVSLMTGLGFGGDAEGDTLSTIENLTGSNLNDTLEGNGGGNTLAGGLGIDTASYEHALAGVTVTLATTKSQNTVGAGSDKLSGFENLTGSAFNDKLTGSTLANILHGGAGDDILTGGTGADTFDFSSLTDGSDIVTDFVTGTDHIDLADLLYSAGLGSLDYATLIAHDNLLFQTGAFDTTLSSNSAATLDTRIYIDTHGIGTGGPVLIATLEDTLTSAGDFLI